MGVVTNGISFGDTNVFAMLPYYYWVRAKNDAGQVSPQSYVGSGYASVNESTATARSDLIVTDLVWLPILAPNGSMPGVISCRIKNLGPDALTNGALALDTWLAKGSDTPAWLGVAYTNLPLSAGEEQLVILNPTMKQGICIRADLSGDCQGRIRARSLSSVFDPNLTNNISLSVGAVTVSNRAATLGRAINDYDGDGRSDGALYSGTARSWGAVLSGYRYQTLAWANVDATAQQWVPGDYDGDTITDLAWYDSQTGAWIISLSSLGGEIVSIPFGGSGYRATPCDADGDGITDLVVYKADAGYWGALLSGQRYAYGEVWVGNVGYTPVPGDYDGDGIWDPMVYNETTGQWMGLFSSQGYAQVTGPFGGPTWRPVKE